MESPQVVCSSPAFCKLEPESPPSWETVDFTESSFGEYWPEDWEDVKDSEGIKNLTNGDMLLDLDLLMKEESFTWIDDRNDGLYTTAFDWPSSDVKAYNTSTSPSAVTIDQKPFVELTNSVNNNGSSVGVKMYHTNHHSSLVSATQQQQLVANATPSTATPDLLREFEDVLISTSTGSLTPPESPRDQTSLITLLQEMEPCTSSSNDIDTIVRNTQAENMIPLNLQHQQQPSQPQQHYIQQSPPSPDPWSSPSMGSNSSSCSDSGYDDPDWSPSSPSLHHALTSNDNHHNGNTSSSSSSSSSSTRRKRAAATTTEERKLRKKEQNKNAATRYRQKKKQEIEVIIGEERELLDKHEHLKADVTEITREIRYLKSLLRDLYKAKGLLS